MAPSYPLPSPITIVFITILPVVITLYTILGREVDSGKIQRLKFKTLNLKNLPLNLLSVIKVLKVKTFKYKNHSCEKQEEKTEKNAL